MGSEAAMQLGIDAETIQQVAAKLQAEYSERIQKASMEGRPQDIAGIVMELQQKIQELIASQTQAALKIVPKPAMKPTVYDQSICGLDLDMTVYDGDKDVFTDLQNETHFSEVAKEILADYQPYNARKDLLKRSLKLTPKMAPKVFEVIDRCRKAVDLKPQLEIYVCSDVQFNAFCYPPRNGTIIIGVTSALLEKFDDQELAFVIGHEIGHALFQHYKFPIQLLLERGEGRLSSLHAMKLFSWKRSAEITADRVGLVCAQNFDAAARAFFKLSSGITDDSLAFQLNEYIGQFTDLKTEMSKADVDPEDWYSTHPFSPMRITALSAFHRSETYMKLIGKTGGETTEADLEKEVKAMMSLMEPSYLQESSELATFMRRFVFIGGYLISSANGVVDESEIKALGSLLDPTTVHTEIEEIKKTSEGDLIQEIQVIAEKLRIMVPQVSRLNLIKDLSVISYADGTVEQSEVEVLYNICNILGIHPSFADHVLESVSHQGQ